MTSHFGYSYYVIFADDYSKYTWLFPMKKKSDVFSIFCDFHVKAKRQFSTKLLTKRFMRSLKHTTVGQTKFIILNSQ